MTTILFFFFIPFGASLMLTPLVRALAIRFGMVDNPSQRKVHDNPLPRLGGIAIFIAFFLPFGASAFYQTNLLDLVALNERTIALFAGAALVFGLGLWDDIQRLSPWTKFGVQIAAASICWFGGLSISIISLPWNNVIMDLGWLGLPGTILWFLLVINAINLIDGLDGLAAGVVFFVTMVLMTLSLMSGKYLTAMYLAALAGSTLGFLRYNFNPASIFMGDAGSYFLGYMLAALSIHGAIKGQAAVAMIIPVIALGLPLIDVMVSPLRRFVQGRAMFKPDRGHIHHRLLAMGLSHRRVVIILYAATIVFGVFALLLVNLQDARAGLILLLLGVGVVVSFHKLGYIEYLTVDKIIGYFFDITDEMFLRHERRTFLGHQVAISRANSLEEMWEHLKQAFQILKVNNVNLEIDPTRFGGNENMRFNICFQSRHSIPKNLLDYAMVVELPIAKNECFYGKLTVEKLIIGNGLTDFTLRRVEHLRKAIAGKLDELADSKEANSAEGAEAVTSVKDID